MYVYMYVCMHACMYAYGLIHNQGRLRNGVLHDYMRAVDSVQFIIVFFYSNCYKSKACLQRVITNAVYTE